MAPLDGISDVLVDQKAAGTRSGSVSRVRQVSWCETVRGRAGMCGSVGTVRVSIRWFVRRMKAEQSKAESSGGLACGEVTCRSQSGCSP